MAVCLSCCKARSLEGSLVGSLLANPDGNMLLCVLLFGLLSELCGKVCAAAPQAVWCLMLPLLLPARGHPDGTAGANAVRLLW